MAAILRARSSRSEAAIALDRSKRLSVDRSGALSMGGGGHASGHACHADAGLADATLSGERSSQVGFMSGDAGSRIAVCIGVALEAAAGKLCGSPSDGAVDSAAKDADGEQEAKAGAELRDVSLAAASGGSLARGSDVDSPPALWPLRQLGACSLQGPPEASRGSRGKEASGSESCNSKRLLVLSEASVMAPRKASKISASPSSPSSPSQPWA